MNPRLPYSARTLMSEVSEIDEDAKFEGQDLDGLGTYRTLMIDTGNGLGIYEAISRVQKIDRRILDVEWGDGLEFIYVKFAADRIVESHARFGIRDLYEAILDTTEPPPWSDAEAQSTEALIGSLDELVEPKKKATRKRAAKKTTE